MAILIRYLIRSHIGPFLFSFTLITGLLFLNTIAQRLDQLMGKGLPWTVLGQFALLALPHTVALTLPMSVLVAVLFAFSDLTAENEITAMTGGGVNPVRLLLPLVGIGVILAGAMFLFNDRVLPETNHALRKLLVDVNRKSPTFQLREQVLNEIRGRRRRGLPEDLFPLGRPHRSRHIGAGGHHHLRCQRSPGQAYYLCRPGHHGLQRGPDGPLPDPQQWCGSRGTHRIGREAFSEPSSRSSSFPSGESPTSSSVEREGSEEGTGRCPPNSWPTPPGRRRLPRWSFWRDPGGRPMGREESPGLATSGRQSRPARPGLRRPEEDSAARKRVPMARRLPMKPPGRSFSTRGPTPNRRNFSV